MFNRRIERRMGIHQITKVRSISATCRKSQELELLFKELLIGVTNFFRDGTRGGIGQKSHSALLAKRPAGHALRAWVAGVRPERGIHSRHGIPEAMDKLKPAKKFTLNIFATDLDKDAIDKARQGIYRRTYPPIYPRNGWGGFLPRWKEATG